MSTCRLRLQAAIGLFAGAWFAGIAAAADLSRLDQLLQAGDPIALIREFRSGQYPVSELVPWLRRQAETGHALPQYELAERLKGERLDEALQWYARGRLARLLDEEECNRAGKTNAAGVGWLLDLGYQDLDRLAKSNEPVFVKGVAAALGESGSKPSPSAKWICGSEANLLPPPEARAARAQVRERLERRRGEIRDERAASERPINPDGFAIKHLPERYQQPAVWTWLDSDRLLISARDGNDLSQTDSQFFVWDLGSGEITPPKYSLGPRYFCYFDGYVRYGQEQGDFEVIKAGSIGNEQEIFRRRLRDDGGEKARNPEMLPAFSDFDCKPLTKKQLDVRGRGLYWPLLEGHGFLGARLDADDQYRYVWVSEDGARSVHLPIDAREFGVPAYAPFANTYYFATTLTGNTHGEPVKFWVIFPDGRAHSTVIAYGPWQHGGRRYALTRAGIFFWAHAGGSDGKLSGAYLARGADVVQLLRGYRITDAISPDGCRIAIGYLVQLPLVPTHLSVIDVCRKEGQS
jgi:hypothetical protein